MGWGPPPGGRLRLHITPHYSRLVRPLYFVYAGMIGGVKWDTSMKGIIWDMVGQLSGTGRRLGIIRLAKENCSREIGIKEKCPECGQFHLRPGYCRALNPHATDVIKRISEGEKVGVAEIKRAAGRVGVVPDNSADVPDNVPDNRSVPDNLELSGTSVPDKICEECGSKFQSRRSDAKYCGGACRKKAQRHG